MARIEIPYKFPSLNEYVNACRKNAYAGASMKKRIQKDIGYFINRLPRFDNPVIVHFLWIEGNKRRDIDNVIFAKKFILDALVEQGKLKDDSRRYVVGFTDNYAYSNEWKVVMEVEEVMTRLVCDRCGTVIQEFSHKGVVRTNLFMKLEPSGGWHFDKDLPIALCDKCEEDLYEFVYGEEPKREVEE